MVYRPDGWAILCLGEIGDGYEWETRICMWIARLQQRLCWEEQKPSGLPGECALGLPRAGVWGLQLPLLPATLVRVSPIFSCVCPSQGVHFCVCP